MSVTGEFSRGRSRCDLHWAGLMWEETLHLVLSLNILQRFGGSILNKAFHSTTDSWGNNHAEKCLQSWHRKALWTFTKCGLMFRMLENKKPNLNLWSLEEKCVFYKTLYKIICYSSEVHSWFTGSFWNMLMFNTEEREATLLMSERESVTASRLGHTWAK